MKILNKKYTKSEMKMLDEKLGNGLYFSRETAKFFGTTKTLCYKHSLFIQNRDNFERTAKIYDVKLFDGENARVHTIACCLPSLEKAKSVVKLLQKLFQTGLGFREVETLENISYVFENTEENVIRFCSFKNQNNPSYSFEIMLINGEFQVVG